MNDSLFWSHVDKTGGCWLWTASVRQNGYGQVRRNHRNISAHRYAYQLINGLIPDGMVVDHRCRIRRCVNPQHLRLITQKQNCENRSIDGAGASGIRGVAWDASRNAWSAKLTDAYKTINLGRFATKDEAAQAVRAARLVHFIHNDTDRIPA